MIGIGILRNNDLATRLAARGRMTTWRLRNRLNRWRRAFAYGRDSMTADDAAQIAYECRDAAGSYPLDAISVESVLETAWDCWGDNPHLPRLAATAVARVASKWSGYPDAVSAAEDWAMDLIREYAAEEGIELVEVDEISYVVHPGWTVDDAEAAEAEGWNVFACGDGQLVITTSDGAENRQFDEAGELASLRAYDHVERLAGEGSSLHQRALALANAPAEPEEDDD